MMYKDKDKQREAIKKATQRYRQNIKRHYEAENGDSALSSSKRGLENARGLPVVDKVGDTQPVIPPKVIPERTPQGNIRVSKPGDSDYVPMCETTRTFVKDSGLCPYCLKRPITSDNAISCEECSGMMLVDTPKPKPKRGKDIKHFGDLPRDVQQTIHKLSTTDGKIDQHIKANRTAIAVNYQHIFPDRYHSTSMSTEGAGL